MKKSLLIFCFLPFTGLTQDITGIWTGYLKTSGSQLSYELAISENVKKLSGYSMIVYTNNGVENIGIKTAKLKQGKKEISLEDDELVYNNFTSPSTRSKLICSLWLELKDSLMILRGTFRTRSLDFRDTRTYSGEVYLQKENKQTASKMLTRLEELNLLNTLSFLSPTAKKKVIINKPVTDSLPDKKVTAKETITAKEKIIAKPRIVPRKTETIRNIFFTTDSLMLSLFDNGTIDGDTVSLLLNGKIIVDKLGLSSKAFKITIPMIAEPGDSLELVMYAENLGSIPPNTGLLIIEEGNNRHEIRFAGDLQKSSAIMLHKKGYSAKPSPHF